MPLWHFFVAKKYQNLQTYDIIIKGGNMEINELLTKYNEFNDEIIDLWRAL